jgi:hypothetical protein
VCVAPVVARLSGRLIDPAGGVLGTEKQRRPSENRLGFDLAALSSDPAAELEDRCAKGDWCKRRRCGKQGGKPGTSSDHRYGPLDLRSPPLAGTALDDSALSLDELLELVAQHLHRVGVQSGVSKS